MEHPAGLPGYVLGAPPEQHPPSSTPGSPRALSHPQRVARAGRRWALTSMEMESGSTPRSVLLSKGSKMSSRMLVGCRTYPHCPLDMNKAWFICMGLSGEHR